MRPAVSPIRMADMGLTNPEAGVIATSPATQPEIAPRRLGLPFLNHSPMLQPRAAVAAAKWVFTKALVASPEAFTALPALKPNHPTHSRQAPIVLRTTLCGFIASCG